MNGTMLSVDHSARSGATGQDLGPLITSLKEMAKAIQLAAERPLGEIRIPFPEIHNEQILPSPHIDVHVQPAETKVVVEPPRVDVTVQAPTQVFPNLKNIATAIYVLSGVIGVSFVGMAAILLHR